MPISSVISPLIAAVGIAALLPAAATAAVVYTDSATFLADVQPLSYNETFASLTPGNLGVSTLGFSGGTPVFAYDISTVGTTLYRNLTGASGNFISTYSDGGGDALTITFTSGNVTAVGGNFFLTLNTDPGVAGTLTVNLSDSTSVSVTSLDALPQNYTGFTTTSPVFITSLSIPAVTGGTYPTIANLTVGAAVPEPQHYAMAAGLGLLAFGAFRRVRSGKLA